MFLMLIVIEKYEKVRKSTGIVLKHYSVHGMPLPNKAFYFSKNASLKRLVVLMSALNY
jgi:hypothetical protein